MANSRLQDYWLTLRSHPSTEPVAEVWGWRPASGVLRCRTAKENTAAPHRLERQGTAAHPSELRVKWRPARDSAESPHSIGIREHAGGQGRGLDDATGGTAAGPAAPWRWVAAAGPTAAVLDRELSPATSYQVVVRDERTGAVSHPLRMRTSARPSDAMHTVAWRISEYTFDVDFLQNHDAADARTLPLYVMNSGAINESCYSGFVQGLRPHFRPHPTDIRAPHHPSRGVRRALLGGHACGMLIWACDPMW